MGDVGIDQQGKDLTVETIDSKHDVQITTTDDLIIKDITAIGNDVELESGKNIIGDASDGTHVTAHKLVMHAEENIADLKTKLTVLAANAGTGDVSVTNNGMVMLDSSSLVGTLGTDGEDHITEATGRYTVALNGKIVSAHIGYLERIKLFGYNLLHDPVRDMGKYVPTFMDLANWYGKKCHNTHSSEGVIKRSVGGKDAKTRAVPSALQPKVIPLVADTPEVEIVEDSVVEVPANL